MVASHKILVVDDEPLVNDSCRRVLVDEGHTVATTESGRDGLRRACSEDFDLVLTDLRMPDLDGMELVRVMHQNKPNTPVIVITGFGTIPSAVEAVRLGVADYVEKPLTPAELVEAVNRALEPTQPSRSAVIEAGLVRTVLRRAARDMRYWRRLFYEGSAVLEGLPISSAAKAAIVSGDIAWVEKHCGTLSPDERCWLIHRTEAEL